jgi:Flp pilus assembly protein TadG
MRMRSSDRGAATITTVIMAAILWPFLLGFVVVGGGRIRAFQRADNIAAEAARAAGSAIDPALAVPGGPKVVDSRAAQEAAMDYLRAVGATGTVMVEPGGTRLDIVVHITYANPSGLEFIGGAEWEATGEAEVTLLVG